MLQPEMIALAIGVATLAVHTLSLLSSNEGFRGAGRVFLGFALLALAAFVHATARLNHLDVLVDAAAGFTALSGIVTVVTGARKFLRRNNGA
jgi:hypothetical protein